MVGLSGVKVSDEGVVAAFADGDRAVAEDAAVFVEGLTPCGAGLGAVVEVSGAVEPVEGRHV